MAYRIEGEDKRLDRRYAVLVNFRYSPEVKAIVKAEGVDGYTRETIPEWTFELVRYSPAQ